MKKNNPGALFLRGFIKSFLVIMLLAIAGFGSYTVSMLYFKLVKAPSISKVDDIIKDIVSDDEVKEISKNVIYSIDEETGKIKNIVLEIFNINTYNLDYISVPMSYSWTISNDLYPRLYEKNPEVPQIVEFAHINEYYENDVVCKYGIVLLEDCFNTKIDYYTKLNVEDFNAIFKVKKPFGFQQSFTERISKIKSKEDMESFITEWYESIDSNLYCKTKVKYIEFLQHVVTDKIDFYRLQYNDENGVKVLDVEGAKELIDKVLVGEDSMETFSQTAISSKGYNVVIDNASMITGLAAKYKDKLQRDGYTVVNIGNCEETLNQTRIIVKTSGLGEDLNTYFKNATIQIGELPENIDIKILLGKEDNIVY